MVFPLPLTGGKDTFRSPFLTARSGHLLLPTPGPFESTSTPLSRRILFREVFVSIFFSPSLFNDRLPAATSPCTAKQGRRRLFSARRCLALKFFFLQKLFPFLVDVNHPPLGVEKDFPIIGILLSRPKLKPFERQRT